MPKINFYLWGRTLRRRFNKMFGWYEMIARLLLLSIIIDIGVNADHEAPPNIYTFDNMPNTSFSCDGKAVGGYYADPEAGCQVFHVCVIVGPGEVRDFRFLCPNDTIFDQQNFICANYKDVDCQSSAKYYSKNDLFRKGIPPSAPEYEMEEDLTTEYLNQDYEDIPVETNFENEPDLVIKPHRFESLSRAGHGKSQFGSENNLNSIKSSTTEFTTPVKVTTASTTTETTSTKTTPKITTRRPTYHLPFRPAFSLGKPVVSVSTTTSYEVGYTTRSPISFTNSYGISTTNFIPFAQSTEPTRYDEGISQISSTINNDNVAPTFLNENHSNSPNSESQDPYANYDWKKDDSGIGVTASVRTRYERRFGPPRPRIIKRPSLSRNNNSSRAINTSGEREKRNRTRFSTPAPEHKAFSNFRYYKTAFGRSESVSTINASNSTRTPKPIQNFRPLKLGSTASQNTRYSKYG